MTKTQRWSFFAVVSLGLLMISLDNSILYTALPALNAQLGASPTESLWIINAYPLVLSGLLLGTGSLGDKVGHRLMFVIGLCIFGLASLAAAYAPNALALIIARGFLGAGAAVMMPATLALIRLTFDNEQERNTAIGIWGSIAIVGASLGPVLGGALLEAFWWGSVFLINVPLVVVALVLTFALAPENLPNPTKQWDWVSSVYALLTLSGLTMTIKQMSGPSAPVLLISLTAFGVGAVLFARRQNRIPDPLLDFDIFRSRMFTGGVIAAVGSMFLASGIQLMTTQKLQLVDAFSPLAAGATVIAMALAAFPASVLGGAFLHRIGFLPLIAGGFAGSVLGAAVLITGSAGGNMATEVIGLAVLGISLGSVMSVSSIAILGAAPMHRSGMAAGVEEVSYEFGTLVAVALTGTLLPMWLVKNLPADLKEVGMDAMYDPTLAPLAAPAYVSAFDQVLTVLAVVALVLTVSTWWCFRGNPKSGDSQGVAPAPNLT